MSGSTATYRVNDRKSADRVTGVVIGGLNLTPGGFGEALRTAVRGTACNVADWAGSGEVAVERSPDGVAALFRQGKAVSCSKSSSGSAGVTVRFQLPALPEPSPSGLDVQETGE